MNTMTQKSAASPRFGEDLNFFYGKFHALKGINLEIPEKKVTAFIGPSGCGKSTLLRTFNRMYELYPEQRAEGEILLDGENLLTSKKDVALIRAKVGMVFQKPTPFPMSIYDNIAFGVRLFENLSATDMDERVEWALRKAALWTEVKDKLQPERRQPVGRAAAAPVHCARHCHQARSAAAGRALFGAGSDFHRQDRRADCRAQERLHGGHRDPQHAAGRALQRLHRLHVPGRPDGVWRHRADVLQAHAQRDRRLHHRPFRLKRQSTGAPCPINILSTQFDSELNSVSSRVMEMGGLVESQIRQAIYALSQFSAEAAIRS
jgi:hypothetical protein